MKKPTLAVFWGDTRELLSHEERARVLITATLESLTPNEVLLRDIHTQRLIVVSSNKQKNLFCTLCKTDVVRQRYGQTCPSFAKCALNGKHNGSDSNGEK